MIIANTTVISNFASVNNIEDHIFPFAENGWLHLTGFLGDEELRLFHQLPSGLHRGEASSLAIARTRNWVFLTDDAKARKTANELGVPISGTLKLLVQTVRTGLLASDEADALLGEMTKRGFRSPRRTISELV